MTSAYNNALNSLLGSQDQGVQCVPDAISGRSMSNDICLDGDYSQVRKIASVVGRMGSKNYRTMSKYEK